jgi:hypothetical protein
MNSLNEYYKVKSVCDHYNKNINLIVVTKSQEFDNYKAIIDAGHIHFGENKVQEASRKWSNLIIANDKINLHLLGKLQSNKIKEAFNIFTYFHSLADKKLANLFYQLESERKTKKKYFVQVNLASEDNKNGLSISSVFEFVNYCKFDLNLNILGLMCLPPFGVPAKPFFNQLKSLNDKLGLSQTSMGMSNDFEQALQCGSTYVRVGSAIFGKRFK